MIQAPKTKPQRRRNQRFWSSSQFASIIDVLGQIIRFSRSSKHINSEIGTRRVQATRSLPGRHCRKHSARSRGGDRQTARTGEAAADDSDTTEAVEEKDRDHLKPKDEDAQTVLSAV